MRSYKSLKSFLIVLGVPFLLITLFSFDFSPRKLQQKDRAKRIKIPEFKYKIMANLVLRELDVFEPVDPSYLRGLVNYYEPDLGLIRNDRYCDDHRKFLISNTSTFFDKKINFFTDFARSSLTRKNVLDEIGIDVNPEIVAGRNPKKPNSRLNSSIQLFVPSYNMPTYHHIGKHFSCLTQASGRVPGVSTINRKDWVAETANEYQKNYKDRPQCFSSNKFFPKTWLLKDKKQCEEFFKILNGKEYQQLRKEQKLVYIRKIAGSHRGEGVQPVDKTEELRLRAEYKNGKLCGKNNKNQLIQQYIHNPLLLNGHKFDFRIYMLIASTNPLMVYYHDGFLRVSLHPYDVNSKDKGTLLTNTALSASAFDIAKSNGTFMGMNEEELRNFQMWNFKRLEEHLYKTGKTTDRNWLENYLRPQFRIAMIHLIKMSQDQFLKRSSVYELFGVDFMIDEDLNLWFIEVNSSPMLKGSSEEKEIFLTKMLKDSFEIVTGLLRSRVTRIVNYVNKLLTKDDPQGETDIHKVGPDEIFIMKKEEKLLKFANLSRNYFEPEYEPSPDNGFYKIIDENLSGVERYSGLLSEECLETKVMQKISS